MLLSGKGEDEEDEDGDDCVVFPISSWIKLEQSTIIINCYQLLSTIIVNMYLPLTSKVSKWVKESDDNLTVLNSSKSFNTKLNDEDEDEDGDCLSFPLKQLLPISNELILGNSFK